MTYQSRTFWKNCMSDVYTEKETDDNFDKYNEFYKKAYESFKDKLPKEYIEAYPLLHDARILNLQIKQKDCLEIIISIQHGEFAFEMQFRNVSNIYMDFPFIEGDDWIYDELLYLGNDRFSLEVIPLRDFRNKIYFEFGTLKVEGDKKKLPDGYACLDDYYNNRKKAEV